MNELQPVSDKGLKRGIFWLNHRQQAKKIALVVAIVVLAGLYYLIILNIVQYFVGANFQQLSAELNSSFNWQAYHQQRQPQSPQVSQATAFPLGNGRYNLAAFITNPNDDWFVSEFEYNFVVNGQPQETQVGWLNPGDNKMLLKLGQLLPGGINNVSINLSENLNWKRLFKEDPQLEWEITNVKYQPATKETINGETIDLPSRVTWQARNLSLYNLWTVPWQIALYNRDQLVSVNQIQAEDFSTLENRQLEAVWLYDLGRITSQEVIPDVNWLDTNNFKQTPTEIRDDERVNL